MNEMTIIKLLEKACIVDLNNTLIKPVYLETALSESTKAQLQVNLDDEVVRGAIILHEGKLMWPPPTPIFRSRSAVTSGKAGAREVCKKPGRGG